MTFIQKMGVEKKDKVGCSKSSTLFQGFGKFSMSGPNTFSSHYDKNLNVA